MEAEGSSDVEVSDVSTELVDGEGGRLGDGDEAGKVLVHKLPTTRRTDTPERRSELWDWVAAAAGVTGMG